jgi:urease alpha subunit
VGSAIATAIADFTGFPIGSASTFAAACTTGLTAGANFVYVKIEAIDGTALQFGLHGSARGLDKNNDRNIDTILTGTWAGTLSYGTTPTPLAPATFFGERI